MQICQKKIKKDQDRIDIIGKFILLIKKERKWQKEQKIQDFTSKMQ